MKVKGEGRYCKLAECAMRAGACPLTHGGKHGETIARVGLHEGARSRLRSNKSERKWTEPVEKVVFLKKQAEFRMKGGEMQTKVRLYCRLDRGS